MLPLLPGNSTLLFIGFIAGGNITGPHISQCELFYKVTQHYCLLGSLLNRKTVTLHKGQWVERIGGQHFLSEDSGDTRTRWGVKGAIRGSGGHNFLEDRNHCICNIFGNCVLVYCSAYERQIRISGKLSFYCLVGWKWDKVGLIPPYPILPSVPHSPPHPSSCGFFDITL